MTYIFDVILGCFDRLTLFQLKFNTLNTHTHAHTHTHTHTHTHAHTHTHTHTHTQPLQQGDVNLRE